jgi:putative iron-dependent peroxidase
MTSSQPGILPPVPSLSRYLELGALPDRDLAPALQNLVALEIDESVVVGFGVSLVKRLEHEIVGLRAFPSLSGGGCEVPSTQADMWVWLRGQDRGRLVHRSRAIEWLLRPAFRCDRLVDGFKYDRGLDLSGYEDGIENPKGDDAIAAAFVQGQGVGRDGASFVAVQQWVHDLDHLGALPESEGDNIIGRRRSDNQEIEDAPASAHVKRTAQESFDPPAFVLRRSMPWADVSHEGFMFVAFGKSLDAFEVQLRRMAGLDDGIIDGLFRFTRPVSGSYFWCPPARGSKLDLSALGL